MEKSIKNGRYCVSLTVDGFVVTEYGVYDDVFKVVSLALDLFRLSTERSLGVRVIDILRDDEILKLERDEK